MKVYLIIWIAFLFVGSNSVLAFELADSAKAGKLDTIQPQLPKAFLLGEHEQTFEKLVMNHQEALLSVCDNDMDLAFNKWMGMIFSMEAYADEISYDLKGVKLWLNIFWEEDGSLKHIAYYLKPNSRNIDTQELTAFFSSFMNHYKFPLVASKKFSHYGSAAFPTPRVKKNDVQLSNGKTGTSSTQNE